MNRHPIAGIIGILAAAGVRFTCAASFDNYVETIALLPNGRILVSGMFQHVDGVPRPGIARLMPNGTLDATFVPASPRALGIRGLAVLPDGGVVASGVFAGDGAPHMIRLHAGGAVAPGFVDISGNGPAEAIVVQADGRIVFGGDFEFAGGSAHNHAARANADGNLDDPFAPDFERGTYGCIWSIVQQPDAKLLFGGEFNHVNGMSPLSLARLLPNGDLDPSFGWHAQPLAPGYTNRVESIALQADGRIVVGGNFLLAEVPGTLGLARLGADGSTDVAFTQNVAMANPPLPGPLAVAVLPDHKILVGGGPDPNLVRLLADGTRDSAFAPEIDNLVTALRVQPDGRILIGGAFEHVDGHTSPYLARLLANGSFDETFVVDGGEAVFSSGFE